MAVPGIFSLGFLLILVSLIAGLVLFIVGLTKWRQSPALTWRFLIIGFVLQLWWGAPSLWWISHNVKNYVEFGFKEEPFKGFR